MTTKTDVTGFVQAILHGDAEHREWLIEAGKLWSEGKPIPPPRGKGAVLAPTAHQSNSTPLDKEPRQ